MTKRHYETIKVTLAERLACFRAGASFRELLESKGLIHSPRLHIESWDVEDEPGVRAFRNRKGGETPTQVATEETGIGNVRRP